LFFRCWTFRDAKERGGATQGDAVGKVARALPERATHPDRKSPGNFAGRSRIAAALALLQPLGRSEDLEAIAVIALPPDERQGVSTAAGEAAGWLCYPERPDGSAWTADVVHLWALQE
jgi:hypothetical protein